MSAQKKDRYEDFLNKIRYKSLRLREDLERKYPEVQRALKILNIDPARLREHSTKVLGAGLLTSALLLVQPSKGKVLPLLADVLEKEVKDKKDESVLENELVKIFDTYLPQRFRPLTADEEKLFEKIISQMINIPLKANLEGEHLNTIYGYIGLEQHLRRYPQDRLEEHGDDPLILKAGMAPGLGAWGYFAPSRAELTPYLKEIEKWYVAVQTLYLPDWDKRQPYLKDWYKYRKVLVVNVKNGKAVVAAVADSGPAAWTGKHFGGSPEVMNYLGGQHFKKGLVLLFFVDDPLNQIPLGPVDYNKVKNVIFLKNE